MGQHAVDEQNSSPALSEQLLLSIAEQLKLPLLQIARRAELSLLHGAGVVPERYGASEVLPRDSPAHFAYPDRALRDIQTTADMAVRLLDNYLFGARLALEREYRLAIEPVSVASVLYDTGQQLDAMAKLYSVDLELHIGGRFGPVMTNRAGLQSALVSLGYSLIEALPSLEGGRGRLQLAVHRCRYGIVTGLYSDAQQLSAEVLRQGRKLHGHARQPLAALTHSSGAGVFVADAILQAMDSELKVSRHHNLYGLGTVLHPNRQLQLV